MKDLLKLKKKNKSPFINATNSFNSKLVDLFKKS